jgi:hypothetical protein
MKQAIDELKAIPGVVGGCLFSAQEGLLQSNLPGIFKPDKLIAVGKQLVKLLAAGRMSFDDLNDLSLHYDEAVIVARELSKGLTIFVLCDPSFNHNLLTMSLNLLQEDWRDQPTTHADLASVGPAHSVAAGETKLEPLMAELKAALAKVLGPMAAIIFDETQQLWLQKGGATAQIDDLLEMIHDEIGDPEKIATYMALAAPLLRK